MWEGGRVSGRGGVPAQTPGGGTRPAGASHHSRHTVLHEDETAFQFKPGDLAAFQLKPGDWAAFQFKSGDLAAFQFKPGDLIAELKTNKGHQRTGTSCGDLREGPWQGPKAGAQSRGQKPRAGAQSP